MELCKIVGIVDGNQPLTGPQLLIARNLKRFLRKKIPA
jgi:hypothetical protein